MLPTQFFISIRWKIILLASLVLVLTGGFFIWQQHRLQLAEFDTDQEIFRTHAQEIVTQLFSFQAERIQTLGRILIEHDDVRKFIRKNEKQALIHAVDVLATELSFGQGVSAVIFHDKDQNLLASWGVATPDESNKVNIKNSPIVTWGVNAPEHLKEIAHSAIQQEKPQIRIECEQVCQYEMALPIVDAGRNIGTITVVSSLEDIILNLRHLSDAEVGVLNGYSQAENPFAPTTMIRSISGGKTMSEVLDKARTGRWHNGYFRIAHQGHVYQVIRISFPVSANSQPWLALTSDVTAQVEMIQMLMSQSFVWGSGALILAMLLLYSLLHPTMRRIQHVSQVLPLLGEEKFEEVRQRAHCHHYLPDEMSTLEKLSCILANQLERLKQETLSHAESLSVQAKQLAQERDFIAGLLDTAPVLVLSYNRKGEIQLANQYALETSGFAFSTLMGKHFQTFFLEGQAPDCFDNIINLSTKQVCRNESTLHHANGDLRSIIWFHSRLMLETNNEDAMFLSIGMDVSTQKQQAAEIYTLAFYDPLTRLPNRRLLMDRLHHILQLDPQHQNYCAIIAIDVDGFKIINDTKGHSVGNWILTEVAKRLQSCVDEVNTIVRLGSDEFVVLLEELGTDATQAVIQTKLTGDVIREVMGKPYLWQNKEIHCTGSFGIDLFMGGSMPPEERLKQAEIALHYAKQAGRNSVCFFDANMQTVLEARTTLEADLRTSLPRNQFKLYYQPQVSSEGHVVGAECLLRWVHPQRGLVSPLHFIPLAEETHLILPIGQWVLETACQQIKEWENSPLTAMLDLSVNVSARQFHQPEFVDQVLSIIQKTDIQPDRLKIELTESTILDNILETIEKMESLRQQGVRFSMDDFGTGYSSLAYLTQLPLTQLKIDQAFVRNLGAKRSDAVIVQTIINMAKSLDMDVIAEGVETIAQRSFLKNSGCFKYQGYLFGKPLPITDFMECLLSFDGKSCHSIE